jgi:NAD(P)-dependent dehydrogenase (short-subunit alcohol dehydrogenase family)
MQPQKIFLTGASSGIGQALARAYAEQGATLVGRREDALRALRTLPNPAPCASMPPTCAMPTPWAAAADFLAHVGCPDVVIANAGISVGTVASEREDLEVFRAVMDTNWFGTLTTFQPFLGPMRAQPPGADGWRGTLVGIASVAGCAACPAAGRTARRNRR